MNRLHKYANTNMVKWRHGQRSGAGRVISPNIYVEETLIAITYTPKKFMN